MNHVCSVVYGTRHHCQQHCLLAVRTEKVKWRLGFELWL